MVTPLEAGAWYAAKLGWPIVPVFPPRRGGRCGCGVPNCTSPGKHPVTKHGVHDASTDEGVIKDWIRQFKDYNIGIATGEESGLLVLDIDPRNGGDETLAALIEEYGDLPDVPCVRTGSGGLHFFFRYDGRRVAKLGNGIDVKGAGGFVVGAPSLHVSGGTYEWIRKPRAGEVLPAAPEWISRRAAKTPGAVGNDTEPILEGQRNAAMTSFVGAMRRQGGDYDTMLTGALRYNINRLSPPLDESEVRSVVNSVSHYDPEPTVAATVEQQIFKPSDMGNAKRLVAQHSKNIAYTKSFEWLVWDGQRWTPDVMDKIQEYAKATVESIPLEADLCPDADRQKALHKWATASENGTRILSMIRLARSEKGIAKKTEDFDQDSWLFNTRNGTVDLRTGELKKANRSDYITKMAPVDYNAKAKAPRFRQFMLEIMGGNQHLVDYLQQLFGYALTGDVRESMMPILYGFGANGKSTLLNIISGIMGTDYAGAAPPGFLIAKKNETHPTEVADLLGKRLVTNSETGSGKQLAVDLMKNLTGKDKLKARFMRQDFFEFKPTHKIFLLTNHKPRITDTDHAAWRRLRLIPFTVRFEGRTDEKDLDEHLLAEEASGVLNWMIEGCLSWQRHGLQTPKEVLVATNNYRSESDRLADFLADYCFFSPTATVSRKGLYNGYLQWANSVNLHPKSRLGQNSFTSLLSPRPELGVRETKVNGVNIRLWTGVGLRAELITMDNNDD